MQDWITITILPALGTNYSLYVIINVFGRVHLYVLATGQGRGATYSIVALDVIITAVNSLTGVVRKAE